MSNLTFHYLTTKEPFDVTREQLAAALDEGYSGDISTVPFGPEYDGSGVQIEPVEQEDDDGRPDGYNFIVGYGEYADTGFEAVECAEQELRARADDVRRYHERDMRETAKRALRERLGTNIE